MLLTESRRAARTPRTARWCCSPTRTASRWDRALIAEGQALVRQCLRRGQPGRTRSRPRSAPCTATRPSRPRPTGRQILRLYDQLLVVAPSPVVALNRAVAVAELDGPAAALALVDELDLDRLLPVPRDPRRPAAARWAAGPRRTPPYGTAIARTGNAAERAHLALAKQHLSQRQRRPGA